MSIFLCILIILMLCVDLKKNQMILSIQLEYCLKYTEDRYEGRKTTGCGLEISTSFNHRQITAGPQCDLTTVLHEKKQMGEGASAKNNKNGILKNQNKTKKMLIHGSE